MYCSPESHRSPGPARHPYRTGAKVVPRLLHQYQSLDEAPQIIGEFIARYSHEWLIKRLALSHADPGSG
jgi:hypothetical protein